MVDLRKLAELDLLLPWERCGPGLENELRLELAPSHRLFGVDAVSIARRCDRDDVLFYLPAHEKPLAVVHLTFRGEVDRFPEYPSAEFFASLDDWIERSMQPDNREFEE